MQIGSDSSVAPITSVSGTQYRAEQQTPVPISQLPLVQSQLDGEVEEELAAVYPTLTGSKSYAESVDQRGTEFIANVPYPPGGTVIGPSVAAVENNLNIRIDELA